MIERRVLSVLLTKRRKTLENTYAFLERHCKSQAGARRCASPITSSILPTRGLMRIKSHSPKQSLKAKPSHLLPLPAEIDNSFGRKRRTWRRIIISKLITIQLFHRLGAQFIRFVQSYKFIFAHRIKRRGGTEYFQKCKKERGLSCPRRDFGLKVHAPSKFLAALVRVFRWWSFSACRLWCSCCTKFSMR